MVGRRRGEKRRGRYWIRDHDKEEERGGGKKKEKRGRGTMERVGRERAHKEEKANGKGWRKGI